MELHQSIKAELSEAMKAKEAVRLSVVRSLLTMFMNELVSTGRTPQDWLTDEEAMVVIKRAAKQRKESITQYEAAGRDELVAPEKEELIVLEGYLPQMMTLEEITPVVQAKKAKLGIDDKAKMGILVGAVMKELAGQADGNVVKMAVEATFNEQG